MYKRLFFLITLLSIFNNFFAQRMIFVEDSLSKERLKDVQIIVDDQVYYTNDDGAALIPKNNSEIQFSSSTYKIKKIKQLTDVVLLQPIYKDIEEVVIGKKVDVIEIINNVLYSDYRKNYYLNESTFLINLKQKAYVDNRINNILVSDLNLWTKNTMYNYSLKVNSLNDFINMNVNQTKYQKSNAKNSLFNDIQLYPSDFVYNLFMNVKLSNILTDVKDNKATVKSNVTFEDKDYQRVGFSYDTSVGSANGFILFNKSDKVITSLELNYIYKNSNVTNKVNGSGKKYQTITEKSTVKFDEYKKDGKYYPARVLIKGIGKNIIDNTDHPFTFEQSIIYKQQKKSNIEGLKNKIDLSKPLIENIPTNEVKSSKTLLSSEEQKFVDEP